MTRTNGSFQVQKI